MNKKIAIIGSAGVPARYGGFETFAENLIRLLDNEFEFTVYCSSMLYSKLEQKSKLYNANLVYLPIHANGLSSILYDTVSLLKSKKKFDLILMLGISGALFLPVFKIISKIPVILHPDGMEWKRNRWGFWASVYLKLAERIAIKWSDNIITDNLEIKKYIKTTYQKDSNTITYGGNRTDVIYKEADTEFLNLPENFFLTISRVVPENNNEMILRAFTEIPEKQLVMIGNWIDSNYGKKLKRKYSIFTNIHLKDSVFEPAVLKRLRSICTAYIHGNSCGGTNPSLVEAMWQNVPVFSYDVTFNRITTKNKAQYFQNINELRNLILNSSEEELARNKKDMYALAIKDYKWEDIANEYEKLFLGTIEIDHSQQRNLFS